MDEIPPEPRVGDVERRLADDRLRQALADGRLTLSEYDERVGRCWAARTRDDLEPLLADLPLTPPQGGDLPERPAQAAVPARPEVVRGRHGGRRIGVLVAVAAAVLVAQPLTASDGSAVFGNRVVQVGPGQDQVDVGALFGSATVVVPDGTVTRTTGSVVFGSIGCSSAACGTTDGPRQVVVHGVGGFGSVEVVTPSDRSSGG